MPVQPYDEARIMVHGVENWKETYKHKQIEIGQLTNIIKAGQRLFIGSVVNPSPLLLK